MIPHMPRDNRILARSSRSLLVLSCTLAVIGGRGAYAQQPQARATTRVSGTVLRASGEPLRGAVVRVDGVARATLSDSLGKFKLVIPNGSWTLHVRALGIAALDTVLTFSGGTIAPVLSTARVAVLLDTNRVAARATGKPARYAQTMRFDGFFERRSHAVGGIFLTRDDIERHPSNHAVDLLRDVPGLRVERSPTGAIVVRFPLCTGVSGPGRSDDQTGFGGSSVVELFVDGVRVAEPLATLSTLSASEVEAMEVYRSSSELPAEARGSGCAAIMVWTRYSPGAARDTAP
jgi:hypothetical protein